MKRKISLYFITIMLISLAITSAVSLSWVNNRFRNTARDTLDGYLQTTMQLVDEIPQDPDSFVKGLSRAYDTGVRITLVDREGHVLGDSGADYELLENHMDREEFIQAARTGYGQSVRHSSTLGRDQLYVARSWGEEGLLRFSMPLAETRAFARGVVPVLIVNAVVIILLTLLFAKRLSLQIMGPYEKMFGYLEDAIHGGDEAVEIAAEYEELEPVVRTFKELLGRITGYIEEISRKTEEIETIIGSMEEGLIMLDGDKNVLLMNYQGSRFLEIPQDSWQKNITFLYRNEQFHGALESAADERKRVIADIPARSGKTLRFYINPVQGGGFVLLISDVTELVHLEQVRSEFAANVSHEMKTPLTSISGFAELLQTGMVQDSGKIREYAGKILSESRRLVILIDDVLKLSALESGITEESGPVNVRQVFEYAVQVVEEQIKEKSIDLTIEGELWVNASREKIEELAFNLTDNAIKYNVYGGKIKVKIGADGFSVSDTGIGIPKEHQERVFERFYRVDKARSRKTGGTGLGLSIAKHAAEQFGGRLEVVSEGEGSTFTVAFPAERILPGGPE